MLKMGWISHFLSGVLGGFVFGLGIGFIGDQTPKTLGVPKASGNYFQVLIGVLPDFFLDSSSRLRDLGIKARTNV